MTKEILIQKIKDKLDSDIFNDKQYKKKEIKDIYEAFIDVILDEIENVSESDILKGNNRINIPLLGKLNIILQDSFIGRNPKTKEKIKIPKGKRVYFSPSKKIKDSLNKK